MRSVVPRIDNAELSDRMRLTANRYARWRRNAVVVAGREDCLFIKLHCHGMDPKDADVMIGEGRRVFLEGLVREARRWSDHLHFMTTRELVNVMLALCDGATGDPGRYRNYRLEPIREPAA